MHLMLHATTHLAELPTQAWHLVRAASTHRPNWRVDSCKHVMMQLHGRSELTSSLTLHVEAPDQVDTPHNTLDAKL